MVQTVRQKQLVKLHRQVFVVKEALLNSWLLCQINKDNLGVGERHHHVLFVHFKVDLHDVGKVHVVIFNDNLVRVNQFGLVVSDLAHFNQAAHIL